MTVSTKKAIGDRRGHLSIRRRTPGRFNRQRDVADRRYGKDAINNLNKGKTLPQIADTARTRSRAPAERHESIKVVSVEVREAPAGTTFSATTALDCADGRDESRGRMISRS